MKAGVPIYPLPGLIQLVSGSSSSGHDNKKNKSRTMAQGPAVHAFRTMLWRMRAELKHIQQLQQEEQQQTSNSQDGEPAPPTDLEELYFEQRMYFRFRLKHRIRHLIQTHRLSHPDILQEEPFFTYAEEKALFWKQVQDGQTSPFLLRSHPPGQPLQQQQQLPPLQNILDPLRPADPLEDLVVVANGNNNSNAILAPSPSSKSATATVPLKLSIHEHLWDPHCMGWSSLPDEEEEALASPTRNSNNNNNNGMNANNNEDNTNVQQPSNAPSSSIFSLSADFFHPPTLLEDGGDGSDHDDGEEVPLVGLADSQSSTNLDAAGEAANVGETVPSLDDDDFDEEERALVERMNQQELQEQQQQAPLNNSGTGSSQLDESLQEEANAQVRAAISDFRRVGKTAEWERYSAATAIRRLARDSNDENDDSSTQNLGRLFTKYEQRLKTCLEESLMSTDVAAATGAIEDCFLDFWDECCFPQTAQIHYFDQNTAVPRVSRLEQFLMQPCPKAAGIVQCEIERVKKMSYNSSGTGVKGRFFPTYEYRLFIRHVNPSNSPGSANGDDDAVNGNEDNTGPDGTTFVRNDTLLLVAKHRGRNSSKKGSGGGSNNYALFLPEGDDIEAHFSMVNQERTSSNSNKKSSAKLRGTPRQQPSQQSSFMGRLQGNFIGTEFQLFVPTSQDGHSSGALSEIFEDSAYPEDVADLANPKNLRASASFPMPYPGDVDSDDDGDGYGSEGNISSSQRRHRRRRKSQSNHKRSLSLSRLLLRNSSRGASRENDDDVGGDSVSEPLASSSKRPNRRAIANESQLSSRPQTSPSSGRHGGSSPHREEENVIITYTANLLGSRPRIMDVCIPKVNGSAVGVEWKQYLEGLRRQALEEDQQQLGQQPQSPSQTNRRGGSGPNEAASSNPSSSSSAVPTDDSRRMLRCFRQLQQRLESNPTLEFQQDNANPPAAQQDAPRQENASSNAEREIDVANIEENNFGLMALQNRPPWWNVELGSFVLNFGGRVSVASVKNFQLVDRSHNNPNHPNNPNNNQNNGGNNNDDSNIILQFGRIQGRHSFTMDFQHPLSALQAFSIAISSLQSKISFG